MTADLVIAVDGSSARLEGTGQHLVLRSDRPELMWSSLTHAVLPHEVGSTGGLRAAGRAAQAISDIGLHLDVQGPHGTIVSLGHGEQSIVGRVVTGSSAVRLRSVRSLLPFVDVVVKRILRRPSA